MYKDHVAVCDCTSTNAYTQRTLTGSLRETVYLSNIYLHLICETDTVQPKSSSSCRLICYLIYHYDIWKVRHKWDSNPRSQCPTYPSTIALHVQRLRPLGHRAMRANSNLFHLFSHVLVIDATASLLRLKWVILCGSLWEIASMNNYV